MANTNVVPQGLFGPGILWATRTDAGDTTPVNVGFCNEFSIDMSASSKELFGQNQFPLLVARGTMKCTGKIKAATLSGHTLNTMLIGGTWTAGTQYDVYTAASIAVPTTPFQITPTIPSTGTADQDLGVLNASTLEPMTLVTGTPSAGQYAYASGVYTFSSADNVSGVKVITSQSYHYTSGATGQSMTWANSIIGTTPTFQLDYKSVLYGATYYLRLFNAVCTKTSFGHKLEDFMMPEFDFSFFANASGNIGIVSVATQA